MGKQIHKNIRFIERDYMFNVTKDNAEYLTDKQINELLDLKTTWLDITYKVYVDGSIVVIDNNNDREIAYQDLGLVCQSTYDFLKSQVGFSRLSKIIKNNKVS